MSAKWLPDPAGSTILRPSARALSASDPGVMHSTRANTKTRSNCGEFGHFSGFAQHGK
jgi:hypothetical protein